MRLLLLSIPVLLSSSISSIYNSLDPKDISKQLSFYYLHPHTPEGEKALKRATTLMGCKPGDIEQFPRLQVEWFVNLLSKRKTGAIPLLDKKTRAFLSLVTKEFPNKRLRGYSAKSEEEVLCLPNEEVDIAKALFLAKGLSKKEIASYESYLDLIALQIRAKLPKKASDYEKIETMNQVLFFDMHFRYPHEADFEKKVDSYSVLPEVMLSRRGICLGTCLLYMSLAQRIGLTLEAITPPGHILLRYKTCEGVYRNIETTARGVALPDEVYQRLDILSIPSYAGKECIGHGFMNEASKAFNEKNYTKAVSLYERGLRYLPNEPNMKQFHAFALYLAGEKKQALGRLKKLACEKDPLSIRPNTLIEDLVEKRLSIKALRALIGDREDTRAAIIAKQKELSSLLKKHPQSTTLLFYLAISYLELWRTKEAMPLLDAYLEKVPNDPVALYYHAQIALDRLDYKKACRSFASLKELLQNINSLQNLC